MNSPSFVTTPAKSTFPLTFSYIAYLQMIRLLIREDKSSKMIRQVIDNDF